MMWSAVPRSPSTTPACCTVPSGYRSSGPTAPTPSRSARLTIASSHSGVRTSVSLFRNTTNSPSARAAPRLQAREKLNRPSNGTTSTGWRSKSSRACGSVVPVSTRSTPRFGYVEREKIDSRQRPRCSGASFVGTITVTRGQRARGFGCTVARCGNAGFGRANAGIPSRSRCALTARACSSERPGFAPVELATLPGSFRQW